MASVDGTIPLHHTSTVKTANDSTDRPVGRRLDPESKLDGTTTSVFSLTNPPKPPTTLKSLLIDLAALPPTILISLLTYCPFCVAVVTQSLIQRRAVDTDNWKNEMKGWAWIIGLITFIALLMYPIGVVVWLRGMEGTSVGGIISVFLVLVGCVQFGTVGYAFLKPGLGMVTIPAGKKLNLLSWRNILPLVAPIIEFIQFTSLAFRTSSDDFLCTSSLGTIIRGLVRLSTFRFQSLTCTNSPVPDSPDLFFISTTIAFGVCCLYCLLLGYAIARFLQPGHWLCTVVFEMFAGLAYLPVVSKLLGVLGCRSRTLEDGKKLLYLVYAEPGRPSEDVLCWSGEHRLHGAMALSGLIIFGLSAIFVGSYKADKHIRRSSVTFIPRIVVIKRTVMSVFLALNLHLTYSTPASTTYTHATQSTGIVVLTLLLFIDFYYNSCTFHEIRILAFGAHLAALWSYITMMCVGSGKVVDGGAVNTLFSGWGVVGIGVAGRLVWGWWRRKKWLERNVEKDVGSESQVVFRVVTMRRRIKVAVRADVTEDEERVIAEAIYGPGETRVDVKNGVVIGKKGEGAVEMNGGAITSAVATSGYLEVESGKEGLIVEEGRGDEHV